MFLRFMLALGLALPVGMAGPHSAVAKDKKKADDGPSDLDRMNLAKIMLQDGHSDRALNVLRQVDPTAEGVEEQEYWRLVGLSQYLLDQWEGAEQAYAKAIALGDLTVNVYLQRANALIQLKRPEEAIDVLNSAPPAANAMAARYVLESNAHYSMDDKHGAFEALDRGYQRLPKEDLIARKRVLLLVDLGLYQTAVDEAQVFFKRDSAKVEDYIALATALIEAKEQDRATLLLEQAALLYPEEIEIRSRLALSYFEGQKPLAAGDVLYPVALIDAKSAQSAAELYVKARRFTRAERMNAKVEDQSAKIRQRLIILLEQSHFEAAAALDQRVERLGLLEDENIAYALAYAHYRTGNFPRMERLLSLITDASLFRKGIELRRSAEKCRQSFWKCD